MTKICRTGRCSSADNAIQIQVKAHESALAVGKVEGVGS